ncbi:MAG TPA: HAMP domain-containing sensor histidine kinase, partial [Longimicrobiaceae bacterium]|nr:HAMP domain-containing sensor histidine kinase [Longimicrobiaceae bacterium]
RTFNELLARLEGAFGQQRRFMTDAAHELRTPVAILRGEADVALARDDRPAEEYRGSLRLVREESRRLSGVVDDLFLLARADAGEHLLRPTDFYLNDLVEECVRSARALAAARRIDVEGETDGDAPFRGDEAHLHRLLVNLLDNAIKYSPPGTRVTVTMRREDGRYRVSVRDAGIPVAPELRERIFERFFRAGTTGGSHASGAGLGLAIARWAAEAHGGALVLLPSGPGGGNEFILWLPVPAE